MSRGAFSEPFYSPRHKLIPVAGFFFWAVGQVICPWGNIAPAVLWCVQRGSLEPKEK
jgi:hypothetical protein